MVRLPPTRWRPQRIVVNSDIINLRSPYIRLPKLNSDLVGLYIMLCDSLSSFLDRVGFIVGGGFLSDLKSKMTEISFFYQDILNKL